MKLNSSLPKLLLLVVSFWTCSSYQKLQKETPVTFGKAYCQSWIAGVQGGGSGINIYIPIEGEIQSNISLESVYFRGKVTQLVQHSSKPDIYIGRFLSNTNAKVDTIMSNEPYAEYGNTLPVNEMNIPFEIKNSECIVSYKEGKTTKYFKLEQIIQKEPIAYPSAPKNKQ